MCAKEGDWGPRLTFPPPSVSWPTYKGGRPSPWRSCTEHSVEEEANLPDLYTRKFTGCGASAQSCRCPVSFISIFPLNFQIFFKQSIFLGMITQKGPVGCVCMS